MSTLIAFEPFLETCNSKISTYMLDSNMTSFFRFVSKGAIYWLGIILLAHAPVHVTDFPVVNVHADELSSARIFQHKLCATFSANVKKNINYRLPIKVFVLLDMSESRGEGYNLLISTNPCLISKHILASMIYFLIIFLKHIFPSHSPTVQHFSQLKEIYSSTNTILNRMRKLIYTESTPLSKEQRRIYGK